MFRIIRWPLLALALIVIGLWPAAAAPIALAGAGLAAVIAAIPGPVLLGAAVIAWLRHQPTPARAA
ncbi:hypothetical protein QFZ63_001565 [Streptomyces sp. B3I7]|uniref:hypothetical protein n=1 Tax=Streptomyces sp. B3I7 TaxID=3042269 RepID=UPI002782E685|nr:hypothetical protein [Streptomyces sp. B3I7]MDQ0809851.1 hypothetical protein [Streptomyces sp. B3I7]